MKTYASGNALLGLLRAFGWFVILASAICALVVFAAAPPGLTWDGVAVVVAGGFMGLIMIGTSAIGAAIIDGSEAQQSLLLDFRAFVSQRNKAEAITPGASMPSAVSQDRMTTQGFRKFSSSDVRLSEDEQMYFGMKITRIHGGYQVLGRDGVFKNIAEATAWIDSQRDKM